MLSTILSLLAFISLCSSSISSAAHETEPAADQDNKYFTEICAWLTPHKKEFHSVRKYNADTIEQERVDFAKQKEQAAIRLRDLGAPESQIYKKVRNLEWQFQRAKNYKLFEQQEKEKKMIQCILDWCIKNKPEYYHTLMHMDPELTRALALDKPYEEVLQGEYDEQVPRVAGQE